MLKKCTDEQIRKSIRKHGSRNPNDVFHVVCEEVLGNTPYGAFILDFGTFHEFERRYKRVIETTTA
jgi:hypothetical protein